MNTKKVTRFEVIDHRSIKGEHVEPTVKGRVIVEYGVQVELSLQDDGRTLKVFVNDSPKRLGSEEELLNSEMSVDQLDLITGTEEAIRRGRSMAKSKKN